ncbi:MAG: General secretion pathway protein F [Candidatus Ozemobacter sibiricus]|uniref:General secretion pathway protein F n=1 Tax=Candidatus Ozemobacter sibiricus TaxID=2268124 RepID=A0A367ZR17_9BACT|nr:MAG: General secretion pathway protein F [Candidatus Ozemobacter sibiricus]
MSRSVLKTLLAPAAPAFDHERRETLALVGCALASGTPLPKALAVAAQQASWPAGRAAFAFLREGLAQGQPLRDLLTQAGCQCLPASFRAVLGADLADREKGAVLVAQAAVQEGNTSQLAKDLVYVVVQIAIAGQVLIAMAMFVLPQFKEIFLGMQLELPWTTQVLLEVSDALFVWSPLLVPGLLMVAGLISLSRKPWFPYLWRGPQRLREMAIILRLLPEVAPHRVPYILSVIGHPLLLPLTGHAFRAYGEALARQESPRAALAPLGADPLVACLLHLGHSEGRSPQVLREGVRLLETRLRFERQRFLLAVENLLLLGIGLGVAVVCIGVLLPMVQLLGAI